MDAWETLISWSTISSGDAWEHLQAQSGGGTGTYIILADGVQVEMSVNDIEATVDQTPIEVIVDTSEVEVAVDQSPMEVEL